MSEQALTKIEPMPIESVDRHAGPLDMEPAAFRAGLDRRKENRKALMDWIRAALVENVDFGRIDTKRGKSKPSLFKPGAEKICGMLGIISTFPTLDEYEQVALKGIEIKSVVLRCALLDSRGVIVAEGVGARSLAQDYGDLNKALKMAEKSAHIDATLRMAGLSEVFTQDLEDMPPRANIEPERKPVPQRTSAPATQTATAKPKEPAQATDKTRAWFLGEMRKRFKDLDILQWACDDGPPYRLMPDQTLEEWPLDYVPTTRGLLDMAIKRCAKFLGVDVPPEKPPADAKQSDDGDLGPQKTDYSAAEAQDKAMLEADDRANAEPEQQDDGVETVTGKLEQVSVKEGRSAKGPWKRYGLRVGEEWFNTFDKILGELALKDKGHAVRIQFRRGEKGNDLLSIERPAKSD